MRPKPGRPAQRQKLSSRDSGDPALGGEGDRRRRPRRPLPKRRPQRHPRSPRARRMASPRGVSTPSARRPPRRNQSVPPRPTTASPRPRQGGGRPRLGHRAWPWLCQRTSCRMRRHLRRRTATGFSPCLAANAATSNAAKTEWTQASARKSAARSARAGGGTRSDSNRARCLVARRRPG